MTEFITRNHANEDFEVIIKTDSKDHYKETQDFARRLIDHAKLQTNADRIRAMSDEELANFISSCGCPDHTRYCIESCPDCNLKWLKQTSEVE